MQSCYHGNSQSPWLLTIYLAFPTVSFSINEKNSNSIENKISVPSKLRVKSAEWLEVIHSSVVYSKLVLSQSVLSFLAASSQFCCIAWSLVKGKLTVPKFSAILNDDCSHSLWVFYFLKLSLKSWNKLMTLKLPAIIKINKYIAPIAFS